MADLFLLSEAQMRRIEGFFPLSHGIARVDDRRIVSAIVFVIRNGLRWRDAPREYGPHKTIYNRFIRWSRLSRDLQLGQRKLGALEIEGVNGLMDCGIECIGVGEGLMGEMMRLEVAPDGFDVV